MSEETGAVALVADLMFASRVRGAASAAGVAVATVSRPDRMLEEVQRLRPRLAIVDLATRGLDAPALIAQLRAEPGVQVLAFGPHVEGDALRAARDAGADRVLARSAFVRDLPELLRG